MDSSNAVRGHLDKRSLEWSVWKIGVKMADGGLFQRVTSGNPERFPDENVNVPKSRRSPEIGKRGLACYRPCLLPAIYPTTKFQLGKNSLPRHFILQ